MKRYLQLLGVIYCLLLASVVQATPPPPWIATVSGENLSFPKSDCVQSVAVSLRRLGFARVTSQGKQVFAAFKPGVRYDYKAVVKCFPSYNLVNVTVVAQRSGGLKKARTILAAIRQFALQTEPLLNEDDLDEDATGFPDCSDGPTLIRCLNSVQPDSIDLAVEYLRKR